MPKMLAMEYCIPQQIQHHKYAGSTMSSETLSGSCGSRNNRIRTVRLVRPNNLTLPPPNLTCRHGPSLGFSVRGGREHGTGFFVSHIETGSEAHRQGLRVGDQIIRVNGFTIEDAVHKEVLQLISNHTHVTLKVRGVGMIPVKDKKSDSLSWQIITEDVSSRSSPQLGDKIHDERINIIVAPRSKLGCGICKGPEWKPGIFIQFTKDGGIAREAGLRPGDQILYCNNVDFSDIPFNEAVNLMKTSRQLDLIVRKCAGSELFPGESSGYNSSASSITGDQSPSWSDSKRLSIVKEENLDLEDRLGQLDRYKSALKANKWENFEWEDSELDTEKTYFKPTIINLSENGTTIKNNGSEDTILVEDKHLYAQVKTNKVADICLTTQSAQQQETKTVVVEVHRGSDEKQAQKNNCNNPPAPNPIGQVGNGHNVLSKSSSTSSFTSLSSAISQEIQRRANKKQEAEVGPSIDEQIQKKRILKGVNQDAHSQHNKLMDEFKKAHKKMFKTNEEDIEKESVKEEVAKVESNSTKVSPTKTVPPPPPPPPQDSCGSTTNTLKAAKPKPKAPPVPVKYSTLSYNQNSHQASSNPPPPPSYKMAQPSNYCALSTFSSPPPCPTPDYDTLSLASTNSSFNTFKTSQINDAVEMESLESFQLNNPADAHPKPPNTYFKKHPLTGTLSNSSVSSFSGTLKKPRPTSVNLGDYGDGTLKKPIASQLATELAHALNRGNLKKRTESMDDLLNPSIKPQSNGSVRISLNTPLAKSLAKSTSNLIDGATRVTVNVDTQPDKKNGILKNGNNLYTSHKPLMNQKSITFGEMPTLIKDHPLQVT